MDTLGSLIQLGPVKASPAVREVSKRRTSNLMLVWEVKPGEAESNLEVRRRVEGGRAQGAFAC